VGRPHAHQCDLDPIQGQGQGQELLKFRKLHISRSISSAILARSSKLMVGSDSSDSMGPRLPLCLSPIFQFPSKNAIREVQTSRNLDIRRISDGHISVLLDDKNSKKRRRINTQNVRHDDIGTSCNNRTTESKFKNKNSTLKYTVSLVIRLQQKAMRQTRLGPIRPTKIALKITYYLK